MELAAKEAWEKTQKILRDKDLTDKLARYSHDPIGFCRDILGDTFTDEVNAVLESVRDNRVTIAKSGNAVGKSHSAARMAIWFYKCFPNSQVYVTAAPPLDNLRRILWGHIMSIATQHPDLFIADTIRSLRIARHETSFVTGVAIPTSGTPEERESKFSGKHAPSLLFIVDEGDAVPDEVYRGIEGCMSGEHDRLLIMFNPRGTIGPVYYKEVNNQAKVVKLSAINHPNVIEGKNIIPGAVTRDTTIRRINTMTRPLVPGEKIDAECWQVPDFLIGKTSIGLDGVEFPPIEEGYRKITNPAFSYMVLGEYPAQSESQLISQADIDKARSRYDQYVSVYGEVPPKGVQPILGLDVAELGVDANVLVSRYGSYVAKPLFWKGIDPDQSALKALEYYRKLKAQIIMVDGTGIGSSVAPSMARMGRQDDPRVFAISVKVANKPVKAIKTELGEFYSLRDQLWWAMMMWLKNDNSAMLPPDHMLLEDLKAPSYKKLDSGKIKISSKDNLRDKLRRSPDRGDALALTFLPQPVAKILSIGEYLHKR